MKPTVVLVPLLVLMAGCSSKAPDPVKLDGGSNITINQNLLLRHENIVPKDPFLQTNNWTYNIHAQRGSDGELLKNDQVVKTFLLAHNATKIIIIGADEVSTEYRNFLRSNGVTAEIELQPVSSIEMSKDRVNILFFHKKDQKTQ